METIVINQIKDQSYTMKESLRALKTSISFSGKGVKSILFTSSVPNEGKTTVVMDLARSMADSKKSVLVVDTDMRKSVLVGRLRAKVESGGKIYGLSHYLSGQVSLDKVVYATNIKGVFILFAGHEVPNPTELLETEEFKELIEFGEKNFDYVLVDTPPTGAAELKLTVNTAFVHSVTAAGLFILTVGAGAEQFVAVPPNHVGVYVPSVVINILSKTVCEAIRWAKITELIPALKLCVVPNLVQFPYVVAVFKVVYVTAVPPLSCIQILFVVTEENLRALTQI